MNSDVAFEIQRYDFNWSLFNKFQDNQFLKNLWPIVYVLSDGNIKEAYVGETTDAHARMEAHLRNNNKSKLTIAHLVTSKKFNKSATLDIESNLIKYISGDGQYKLLNGNLGLANHDYYQKKEIYWDIFKSVWNRLRAEGICKHSIEYIDNSDLFKYSPYKSLTKEQSNDLLVIMKCLLKNEFRNIVVEGGSGTGKTVLATFLFKLLNSDNQDFNFKEFGDQELEFIKIVGELKRKYPTPKMALVIPMASFRNTIKKVFKNIKGLNAKMVIGPAEVVKDKFDIVVVDESHRLRRRVNLGSYFKAFDIVCQKLNFDKAYSNELEWIIRQSENTILFYDNTQSIKPSDIRKEVFDNLKIRKSTKTEYLTSQLRVKGGNEYVQFIKQLLGCVTPPGKKFQSKKYEFLLFDSIADLEKEIKIKNEKYGLSRLIAGYSWKWISKEKKNKLDIQIDNIQLKWNSVSDDWVNSNDSINEVGCIHTTQGYDLNYAAIIFGNEITFDKKKNEIVILKQNYYDSNGKNSIKDPAELKNFIINIYNTLMLRSIRGTYVFVCDKHLREYFAKHLIPYKEDQDNLLNQEELIPFVNSVPLYDLKAAAGNFSDLQTISDTNLIPLPTQYKSSRDLFACFVLGESMNKVIPNGSMCLFRKYTGGSRNGKIVLVQHFSIQDSNFGSGYTVKEYHSKKNIDDEQWHHESITLRPLSYDSGFKEIKIVEDELSNLKVIGIFECVL